LLQHIVDFEIFRSDPKSSIFGNHYTANEITDLFAPSTTTVEVVKSWIVDSGIREERISQSSNKAWLQFDASIEEMEQLLQTKYRYYEHISGGVKHIGCEDYKVPEALSDHIDYITPGVKPLATRVRGGISKRKPASLRNRGRMRKIIPADVLAKIKENSGTFIALGSVNVSFHLLTCGLKQTLLRTAHPPSLLRASKLCTTSQLAHFQIPKIHLEFSRLVLFILRSIWTSFSKHTLRRNSSRISFS
jgi:hypothetical protein